MKTALVVVAVLISWITNAAPVPLAREQAWNADWRFCRGDWPGAEAAGFDDSQWRKLDLPHDWSIEDLPAEAGVTATNRIGRGPFDAQASAGRESTGWVVGGTGWYRKHFRLPGLPADRRVEVRFDGVYMDSEVFLNGTSVAAHPYGYTAFTADLTPHLNRAGENVLAVRVRNEGRNSRWYSGSGIYRQVWLTITGPVHVPTWGLTVVTPDVTAAAATLNIGVELANAGAVPVETRVAIQVLNPAGELVEKADAFATVAPGGADRVAADCRIGLPQLWSPEHPALYRAVAKVIVKGQVVDQAESAFGIRRIEVDAARGFRLNGEPLKLQGACVHHDNGVLGAATIPRAEIRRVELMKAAGYNAIRTSHNPPSTVFLDACDRLGMLVIDEAFDQWEKPKNPQDYSRFFAAWAERDIAAMVRRDRNHPSVIVWSIGNEIQERFDRPDLAERLRKAVLQHDQTRPITAAICGMWDNPGKTWGVDSDPAFLYLDLCGMNYLCQEYEADHSRFPNRVMVCTESFPKDAFQYWALVEKLPYVIGDFVWTGFDYLGESGIGRAYIVGTEPGRQLGAWPWHIAGCGDLDLLGRRKPWSYYREALWRPGVLHMAVRTPLEAGREEKVTEWGWRDVRSHWTWPGEEGRKLTVEVYSSCDQVALYLNGKLLEEKPTTRGERNLAVFEVPYQPGELRAVGTLQGHKMEHVLRTAGAPAALRMIPDRPVISTSRDDLAFVEIEVVDAKGIVVPQMELPVRLRLSGPGELAALGNANPVDAASFRGPVRKSWNGTLQAIIRPTGKPGWIDLRAESEGLGRQTISIKARP